MSMCWPVSEVSGILEKCCVARTRREEQTDAACDCRVALPRGAGDTAVRETLLVYSIEVEYLCLRYTSVPLAAEEAIAYLHIPYEKRCVG